MAYHPFRHLGLKLLAVVLASLLWLTVTGDHVVERSMRVPLEFRNPQELEIVGDPPGSVDVRLRGSSALLGRLETREIVAVLDLESARVGSRLFHIRPDEVRVPYGVEVAQVVPATLPLTLEKPLRRSVPIIPSTDGQPAPGFVVGRISTDPPAIDVVGPESRVKQLAAATTEPVDVTGRRERVRDQVNVGLSDPAVRLVHPQFANVIVEIIPAPIERQIERVPVRWRNLATGLRAQVSPPFVRVTVRGSTDAVQELEPDAILAFVDLAGLGTGRYNLRVQVDPSQSFGISALTPAVVDVVIK